MPECLHCRENISLLLKFGSEEKVSLMWPPTNVAHLIRKSTRHARPEAHRFSLNLLLPDVHILQRPVTGHGALQAY